jgi:hypothetical protein
VDPGTDKVVGGLGRNLFLDQIQLPRATHQAADKFAADRILAALKRVNGQNTAGMIPCEGFDPNNSCPFGFTQLP